MDKSYPYLCLVILRAYVTKLNFNLSGLSMIKKQTMSYWVGLVTLTSGLLAACGGNDSSTDITNTTTSSGNTTSTTTQLSVEPANFLSGGLQGAISTVSCTLSGGTTTSCYKIVTVGAPSDHAVGPFCPSNVYSDVTNKTLSTDTSTVGMWIESGKTYALTGQFIGNLATFYGNSNWQLFDSTTGKVNVTDTQALFEAAAVPNVPLALNKYCVEGKMSYVGGGFSRTILIPVTPVALSSGTGSISMSGVGVALNGIVIDAPAPVANIKAAYTIAAFDKNGGHVNPHTGYHYHAATGSSHEVASTDGHSALIGYALDGYGIYALKDTTGTEPTALDTCRGHSDSSRGYHYHAASAGENMFIGCFKGQQGSST